MEKEKLSFCYVTAQYFPHIGGVERYTYNLSKELVNQGHNVTIVTSATEGEADESVQEKITIVRLPAYQLMSGRYPWIKKNKRFREVTKKLEKQHFDQVIVNTRFYLLSIWGARFAKRNHIPCMVIEHGTAHLKMDGKFLNQFAALAEHIFAKWINLYHPIYMGVSKAACHWLKHFGLAAEGIVYNSVDYQEIERYRKEINEQEEDFPANTKIILYAGRLIKEKGVLQLMEAVRQIVEKMPVRLIIVGDGPLSDIVRKGGDPICYLGSVDMKQVIKLLDRSDVFCLPSDAEGFPTSVLEAAACSTCVVATTSGGTGEILVNNEVGVCLSDNTVQTIEQGLYSILLDDEERKKRGKKLHDFVIKHFTWSQTAATIEKMTWKNYRKE